MLGKSLKEVVAANVRRLRQSRRWSQETLASKCGLHRTYVGAVERCERNITLETLERLAAGLACSPEELISESGGNT